MRRVVVTGIGIVSSIGKGREEVSASLRAGRSGIVHCDEYEALKMRSHVHGALNVDFGAEIDRKLLRFMGDAAAYSYIAMREAVEDTGLPEDLVSHPRSGLVVGTGGGSPVRRRGCPSIC